MIVPMVMGGPHDAAMPLYCPGSSEAWLFYPASRGTPHPQAPRHSLEKPGFGREPVLDSDLGAIGQGDDIGPDLGDELLLFLSGRFQQDGDLLLGRNLVFSPDRPDLDHEVLEKAHLLLGLRVNVRRIAPGEGRRDQGSAMTRERAPDLLGDNRHERVQELHDMVQRSARVNSFSLIAAASSSRFIRTNREAFQILLTKAL